MTRTQQFIQEVNQCKAGSEHPNYQQQAEKTVSFMCFPSTRRGMYQAIMPAMYLHDYMPKYRVLTTTIPRPKPYAIPEDYQAMIWDQLVRESDTIIFPFTSQDLTETWKLIRFNNKKCKIIYIVDYDFLDLPQYWPNRKMIVGSRGNYIKNIQNADKVMVYNQELMETIIPKLQKHIKGCKTVCAYMPPFFATEMLEDLPEKKPTQAHPKKAKKKEPYKILIIARPEDYTHIHSFKGTLKKIMTTGENDRKLIVMGFTGNLDAENNTENCLKGIPHENIKPPPAWLYLTTIQNIKPDLCIMPMQPHPFSNSYSDLFTWLDAAVMGIPMLASQNAELAKFTRPNCDIIFAQNKNEWINELQNCIAIGDKPPIIANDAITSAGRFDLASPSIQAAIDQTFT